MLDLSKLTLFGIWDRDDYPLPHSIFKYELTSLLSRRLIVISPGKMSVTFCYYVLQQSMQLFWFQLSKKKGTIRYINCSNFWTFTFRYRASLLINLIVCWKKFLWNRKQSLYFLLLQIKVLYLMLDAGKWGQLNWDVQLKQQLTQSVRVEDIFCSFIIVFIFVVPCLH